MKKSILKQIEELISSKAFKDYVALGDKKSKVYVNKSNPEDKITSIEEAFAKKVNLQDYEEVELSLASEILEVINDGKPITKKELSIIDEFINVIDGLDVESEYKKELSRLNNAISRAKGNEERLAELKAERDALNAKFGKSSKPRKNK